MKLFLRSFNKSLRDKRRHGFVICLVLSGLSVTGLACGWFGPINSVRFTSFLQGEDFYRLPPLPKRINAATGKPHRWFDQFSGDSDYVESQARAERSAQNVSALWEAAAIAEERGDWPQMRQQLERYLRASVKTDDWNNNDAQRQACRNSAIDRLDVLRSLAQGAGQHDVKAYLAARAKYDLTYTAINDGGHQPFNNAEDPGQELAVLQRAPALRDNVAYLQAALLYQQKNFEAAEQAFRALVRQYPRSEKREAAQLMSGLAALKQSACYNAEELLAAGSTCQDEAWERAKRSFSQQLAQNPHGRFAAEARGWLGYVARSAGDKAGALIEYYRLLSHADVAVRMDAAQSLALVRHGATLADLERVEAVLSDEPAAALAYAYHNLYNYAYAVEPGSWSFYDNDEEKAKDQLLAQDGRIRIVKFAERMALRHAGTSGAFLLRIAQAKQELGEYHAALQLSRRALRAALSVQDYREALWVKAAAECHLGDYVQARQSLNTLIVADQNGGLTEGARRLLAIAAEKQGDFSEALAQYLALGYDTDAGYLLDVLMTPGQISQFIEKRATVEQRNELRYALGVRWLRAGRWGEARAALAQVLTVSCTVSEPESAYLGQPRRKPLPKFDAEIPAKGICAQWLMRDHKTIDDLERLAQQVDAAMGDEAKAEALYQLASYQYEGSTQLFYNPRLWNKERFWLLSGLAESSHYLVPNEAGRLLDYMNSHDSLARALPLYLAIADRYPQTAAAGDALYTAAVCHTRLASMNNYWRAIYGNGLFAGTRLVTYSDVKKAYPKYRFPRGDMGWEPMTRTVNGGPRWVQSPKPMPRLTRRARLHLKLQKFVQASEQRAHETWENYAKPYGRFWAESFTTTMNAWLSLVFIGLLVLTATEAYKKRAALIKRVDGLMALKFMHSPVETLGLNQFGEEKKEGDKSPVERIIDDG